MPNFTIGTAGHAGHGKTALINALTDYNSNKPFEERRIKQSATQDLIFSYITLPSETVCDVVDVPGYKKYINVMIAGLGGVDLVLLVIDAGKGIEVQTREHFEIIKLLEIQVCIPVISRIDMVPPEQVDETEKNVKDFLKGSLFEKLPVVKVSSQTGEGIEKLINLIDKIPKSLVRRDIEGSFRMPVDRILTIPGAGAAVAGTIYQGATEPERTVEILPTGKRGKIRQIRVYDTFKDKAEAGQRAVLNISKIDLRDVRAGDQVIRPGLMKTTQDLDVKLYVLPSSPNPVKNKVNVNVHIASGEAFGKVILLDRETLEPGESGYARIVLEKGIGTLPGDRFILRTTSGIYTWGGGKVIDAHPTHHRRFDKSVVEMLKLKDEGSSEELAVNIMDREPHSLYNQEMLASALSLSLEETGTLIKEMQKTEKLYRNASGKFQLLSIIEKLADNVTDILKKLQKLEPEKLGRHPDEVKRNLQKVDSGMFREILVYLKEQGRIVEKNGLLVTSDFSPELTPELQKVYDWIQEEFKASDFSPPTRGDLHLNKKVSWKLIDHVIDYMVFRGELVAIDENIYFPPEKVKKAKRIIGNYIIKHGEITPAEARELLETTRKYIVPLLEYFDRIYFTRRKDSKRVLFREKVIVTD
jgi:selenocysteine-specific elongation factor